MVSVNPNPPRQNFFDSSLDVMNRSLPGVGSFTPTSSTSSSTSTVRSTAAPINADMDDPSKKIRKPYTITKSRESWTEQEHDKFLEALQLFDRDWKKIEAFVGSKTVIQIRSHAQKYFLKVQKSGTSEHVPPPRPKRKASHPYPHKASKNVSMLPNTINPCQLNPQFLDHRRAGRVDSFSVLRNPNESSTLPTRPYNSAGECRVVAKASLRENDQCAVDGEVRLARTCRVADTFDKSHGKATRVMPDFVQVYTFLGSVFDPQATDHVRRLRSMDPINVETALLLMRNLSLNLISPEFEDHRKLLSSSYHHHNSKSNGDPGLLVDNPIPSA